MTSRSCCRRIRRAVLAALVTASVSVPVAGAAGPGAVPAPPPAVAATVGSASPEALRERYAATRAGIAAARRVAADHGDAERATTLRALAQPGRRFLFFDGRDGGRAVEVVGDLAHARHIAVLVPGSDTGLGTYERFREGAVTLHRRVGRSAAVIAWLGYRTPGTVSLGVLAPARAHDAAPRLRRFVTALAAARPAARISLLCHSYGSVVCAAAAPGLRLMAVVLYGSPGTGFEDVEALGTEATVWVGRGADDWIEAVPHVQVQLPFGAVGFGAVGFGTDPMTEEFGARVFDAGPGGHSDYLAPGSVSLGNIARIVTGRAPLAKGAGRA